MPAKTNVVTIEVSEAPDRLAAIAELFAIGVVLLGVRTIFARVERRSSTP